MIFIVLALAALLAVIGYNMYQENQYRKQVREQFGHSDKDALLTSKPKHVRDSKETGGQGLFIKKNKKTEEALRNLQEQDEIYAAKAKLAHPAQLKTNVELTVEDDFSAEEKVQHTVIGLNNEITVSPAEAASAPV